MKRFFIINVLFFIAICCSAQFEPTVFQPQPVDMSILQRSYRQREERKRAANEAIAKLNLLFADCLQRLHNDPETLGWFNNYKSSIMDEVNELEKMGYDKSARDKSIKYLGEVASNAELNARIRTNEEYETIKAQVMSSNDIDYETKNRWINENQYRFVPIKDDMGTVIGGKKWEEVGGKDGGHIWLPGDKDSASISNWTGTGFALKKSYLVTNNHVVEGANSIKVYGINGDFSKAYTAEIVGTDNVNDLALLKITSLDFAGFGELPYSVNTSMSETGEDVFVLGYPLTQLMGNEIKLTTGIISSRSGFNGNVNNYQITAPVQPGNSGGPMFNKRGNIAGIIVAGMNSNVAQNANYSIKTSCLSNLVESVADASIIPDGKALNNQPLVE